MQHNLLCCRRVIYPAVEHYGRETDNGRDECNPQTGVPYAAKRRVKTLCNVYAPSVALVFVHRYDAGVFVRECSSSVMTWGSSGRVSLNMRHVVHLGFSLA